MHIDDMSSHFPLSLLREYLNKGSGKCNRTRGGETHSPLRVCVTIFPLTTFMLLTSETKMKSDYDHTLDVVHLFGSVSDKTALNSCTEFRH